MNSPRSLLLLWFFLFVCPLQDLQGHVASRAVGANGIFSIEIPSAAQSIKVLVNMIFTFGIC